MFRFFRISLYIIVASSIGSFHYVNPEMRTYVEEVQTIIETSCNPNKVFHHESTLIDFNDLPGDEIGLCGYTNRSYFIDIDKKFWYSHGEEDRFSVVAHEMFHCNFHQSHVDDEKNFMYPYLNHLPKEEVIRQFKELCK